MKAFYGLVGMKHRNAEALVASLPNGEPLTLIREPGNKYDANAVQVWARGQFIGYIGRGRKPGPKYAPGNENEPIARYFDEAIAACNSKDIFMPAKFISGSNPRVAVE